MKLAAATSANDFHEFVNKGRRELQWEADGVESCVGLICNDGFAFVVNGKIDGNARIDAGTQVMLGLVPAMIHPAPREALVVGLGTGSTAGWLAECRRWSAWTCWSSNRSSAASRRTALR